MEFKFPFHVIFLYFGLLTVCCAESQFSDTVTIGQENDNVKNNGNDDFKQVRPEDLFKNIKQKGLLLIPEDRKDDVSEDASSSFSLTLGDLKDVNNKGLSVLDVRTGIHFEKARINPYNTNAKLIQAGAVSFPANYHTRTKRTRIGVPCAWCNLWPRPGKHNNQSSVN